MSPELPPTSQDDARNSIFAHVRCTVERMQASTKPVVVGITGIDTAGKTEFTLAFARHLKDHGLSVQVIHLDDFQNPRRIRYAGSIDAQNYFELSFDLPLLIDKLLGPIMTVGAVSCTMTLLDVVSDRYTVQRKYVVDPQTVVLLEGVFLFREELVRFLDYKIYLDIPFDVARSRIIARDVPRFGSEVVNKVDRKYLGAQAQFIAINSPSTRADLVVENSDWTIPRVLH